MSHVASTHLTPWCAIYLKQVMGGAQVYAEHPMVVTLENLELEAAIDASPGGDGVLACQCNVIATQSVGLYVWLLEAESELLERMSLILKPSASQLVFAWFTRLTLSMLCHSKVLAGIGLIFYSLYFND